MLVIKILWKSFCFILCTYYFTLFNTATSAAPQNKLCQSTYDGFNFNQGLLQQLQ